MNPIVRNILSSMLSIAVVATPAMAEGLQDKLNNLQISGFVDASYSGDNQSKTRGTGLDQIELDIEYAKDNVGLRFDLQTTPSTPGPMTGDQLTEQGYVYVNLPILGDDGATFTFGKFNAPIGWELLDAPDMYQFSHAMVFNNGIPTNFTGGSLASKFGIIDAIIYGGNYVDLNGVQPNGSQSFGTRVGLSPMDGLNLGLSYLHTTNPGSSTDRTIDIDFTYDAIENLIIGVEYNTKKNGITPANPIANTSGGYFATAHYDITSSVGATIRFGTYDYDTSLVGKANQTTLALTSVLGDGLGALFEYRTLQNTMASAIDGAPANTTLKAYAFEMTYAF
ncbi:MAG: outer membrane beta-barrel protein [Mariprofundaceae bacterium]|nr:outer membrane beta-barrel protein [Mariprofundaceae bacterium]